jgi:hypothetical protein
MSVLALNLLLNVAVQSRVLKRDTLIIIASMTTSGVGFVLILPANF